MTGSPGCAERSSICGLPSRLKPLKDDPRAHPDFAHHFTAAAPLGEARRAIEYNVLAGRAAIDALAFDRAAELLRTALELGIDEPARRSQVLITLGSAWQRAGGTDAWSLSARRQT